MIQLNGVTPIENSSIAGSNTASGNQSTGAFQSQLSAALSATLEQFGVDPSLVNITIGPVTNSTSTTNTSSPLTGFAAIAAAVGSYSVAAPTIATSTPEAQTDPIRTFDDAYWAKQPDPIKALRNIDDPTQRAFQAANLAASGYKIDVPIMVWGWDPSKVTDLRKSFGYTWVPSAMEAPVEQAPGVASFGQPYDPNSAPGGSIAV